MAFFKVKASFNSENEKGKIKKVTREYLVDGILYGEVEERIVKELTPFVRGGDGIFQVITRYPLKETVFDGGDKYFRIQLIYTTIDEKTEKEKETKEFALVQADDIASAQLALLEHMKGSICDYKIGKVEATKIVDVFFY